MLSAVLPGAPASYEGSGGCSLVLSEGQALHQVSQPGGVTSQDSEVSRISTGTPLPGQPCSPQLTLGKKCPHQCLGWRDRRTGLRKEKGGQEAGE